MMLRFLLLLLCLSLCAGCTPPAELPLNLDDTPGAPFTFADGTFANTIFRVRVPDGWRVITGEAAAPPSVIFSPSACTFIQIEAIPFEEGIVNAPTVTGEAITDESDCPARRYEQTYIQFGVMRVSVYGSVPEAEWESFAPIFEAVRASVQPTTPETTPDGEE